MKEGAYSEELTNDTGLECGGMILVVFSEVVENFLHKARTYTIRAQYCIKQTKQTCFFFRNTHCWF